MSYTDKQINDALLSLMGTCECQFFEQSPDNDDEPLIFFISSERLVILRDIIGSLHSEVKALRKVALDKVIK